MPPHRGPDAQTDGHAEGEDEGQRFDYVGFMERITRGKGEEAGKKKVLNGAY